MLDLNELFENSECNKIDFNRISIVKNGNFRNLSCRSFLISVKFNSLNYVLALSNLDSLVSVKF